LSRYRLSISWHSSTSCSARIVRSSSIGCRAPRTPPIESHSSSLYLAIVSSASRSVGDRSWRPPITGVSQTAKSYSKDFLIARVRLEPIPLIVKLQRHVAQRILEFIGASPQPNQFLSQCLALAFFGSFRSTLFGVGQRDRHPILCDVAASRLQPWLIR
jgi:hypothetical protein